MNRADLADLAQAMDITDADIEDLADRAANQIQALIPIWQAGRDFERTASRSIQRIARGYRVDLPDRYTLPQLLNRMSTAAWWRRALRKRFRLVEADQIRRGAVHRHASPYVSGKALRRHERNVRRMADLLAALEAVNLDTGEARPLDKLAESSQANPAMRRKAMMARIKGIERDATSKGQQAAMLTITAPGRMHARRSSGQANERFDGSTPRQVQTYLHGVWRRAMRALQRQGLALRGLRTVEPHHDGCPHWHVLVFAATDDLAPALDTLRAHALADSPNEPGAAAHRFRVERIDSAKGCAVAYVAKYVAKSIDGHGVDADDETGQAGAPTAARIVAWARTWGIRQFQFFGVPAITPMRELYRHSGEGLTCQGLQAAHEACKANDYAAYLSAVQDHALCLRVAYESRPSSRYAGETTHAITGLCASGADLAAVLTITTRFERWCIQVRPSARATGPAASSWTRFNNCATPAASSTYAPAETVLHAGPVSNAREGRRRRPNESP